MMADAVVSTFSVHVTSGIIPVQTKILPPSSFFQLMTIFGATHYVNILLAQLLIQWSNRSLHNVCKVFHYGPEEDHKRKSIGQIKFFF